MNDKSDPRNKNEQTTSTLPTAQSQEAAESTKPKSSKFTKIFLGVIGCVVLVLLFFVLTFGSIIHFAKTDCSARRERVFNYAQPLTNEFNTTKILSSQPNQDASMEKIDGDCVDSSPQVRATKEYSFALSTDKAAKDIDSTLLAEGFSRPSIDRDISLCNGVNYIKGSLKINIYLKCTSASNNQQVSGLFALVEITEDNLSK
jgi:hypothetical protein